jgi:DNA-binding transcriptional LysR family regulator
LKLAASSSRLFGTRHDLFSSHACLWLGVRGLSAHVGPKNQTVQSERLYREDWICAVARGSRFGDRLSLKQYLAANHIVVATYAGVQTIPDKQLAAVGAKRSSCIRVPYFGVALQCLPGTELVLTLTSGMTSVIKNDRRLRLVKAPQELHAFHFLMAWHPRFNSDPGHVWLREAMRSTTGALDG